MRRDLKVSKEEKDFYLKNCPLKINKNSFRKGYINTLAREKGTGRVILFYISTEKSTDIKQLTNLLILASAYDVQIVVLFVLEYSKTAWQIFKWLQKISKENITFLLIKTNSIYLLNNSMQKLS